MARRVVGCVAALSLASACHHHHRYPPQQQPAQPRVVVGSRADAKLTAGPKDGYHVENDCRERDCFGVVGDGARWFPQMERDRSGEAARFTAGIERLRSTLLSDLKGVRSIEQTGFGVGCREAGFVIYLHDWRELDEAVARIGDRLRADNLREPITVCIGAINAVEVSNGGDRADKDRR